MLEQDTKAYLPPPMDSTFRPCSMHVLLARNTVLKICTPSILHLGSTRLTRILTGQGCLAMSLRRLPTTLIWATPFARAIKCPSSSHSQPPRQIVERWCASRLTQVTRTEAGVTAGIRQVSQTPADLHAAAECVSCSVFSCCRKMNGGETACLLW
jgi:hypothetical protein